MTNSNPNAPMGRLDAQGRVIPSTFGNMAFRGEYAGNNLIYSAFARPGSATSDPVWQIAFLTYDGSGNVTAIEWPENSLGNASTKFEFVYDDRATYTYS